MMGLLGGLGGKLIAIVAALGILGGAYLWITTAAYNRGHVAGVTETTERMKKAIDGMKKVATENQDQWQRKTPTEKVSELQKRCVAACQQEPKCEAACRE